MHMYHIIGWLHKLGGKGWKSNWRRRWVVLNKDGEIYYYENKSVLKGMRESMCVCVAMGLCVVCGVICGRRYEALVNEKSTVSLDALLFQEVSRGIWFLSLSLTILCMIGAAFVSMCSVVCVCFYVSL